YVIKRLLFVTGLIFITAAASAQLFDPVKWSFSAKPAGNNEAELIINAKIDKGWHVYSQCIKEGGPIPTSFKFTPSADYALIGKVSETPKAISTFDKNFNMQIAWHKDEVAFKQRIKLNRPETTVKGSLEFMVCNDEQCLPPA